MTNVKVVTQVKLAPTPEQAAALECTMRAANAAANWVSHVAYERGVPREYELRRHTYTELKACGLGAQAAQHTIKKVRDAYTTLKANIQAGRLGPPGSARRTRAEAKPIAFRLDAAQPFDDRCLSWQYDAGTVSIRTTNGQLKNVRFASSREALTTLRLHRRGESDLVCRDGVFYLVATCDVPEMPVNESPTGCLGVDLGIVNVATMSDGTRHSGRALNRYRRRQADLRRKLQAKGTKSAKRLLKKHSRKETRFASDQNHRTSEQIVNAAERTGRGAALEDLSGIRDRVRLPEEQRQGLHTWSFRQLGQYIAYKARRAGVPLAYVDPAHTSQQCSVCGHADPGNRPSQADFACRSCGASMHADHNASRNIARKGPAAWIGGAGHASRQPAHRAPRRGRSHGSQPCPTCRPRPLRAGQFDSS